MKTAFYPCCNSDIEAPLRLLSGYVDNVIFCDVNPRLRSRWKRILNEIADIQLPTAEFIVGDAKEVCLRLPVIDVLFYRKDGTGEGGSGLFVLGDMILRPLLQHFPSNGGLILTDGSNSRGSNFKKMVSRNGLIKHGWKFSTTPEQPYLDQHGLWRISVSPIPEQPSNFLPPRVAPQATRP
jgi:hypothetical protein